MLRKIVFRALAAILASAALLYAGDYVSVRYRLSKNTPGDPLETVQVQRMYAIPHKDGRQEFAFGEPGPETCVHSIFPHLGYPPCWYLKKNAQKPISL
ncbi:MAG TPA: hypothetical protein VLY23_13040 [Candidatus Acidoferrum sp.]|nr:hypothetical protein [Candidatus Acidoferrum sp.]